MVNTVRLPWPPSVNQSTRNVPGKGRVKTKAYSDWRRQAEWLCKIGIRPLEIGQHYAVHIKASRPDRRKRDIDNFIKPVVDALVASGKVPDDCLMEQVKATWVDGLPDRELEVEVRQWP